MSLSTRASRRRFLSNAGAALIGLLSAVSCSGQPAIRLPGRPPALYRLGLVAPFEGLFAATGYEALEAARSRVQEWNGHLRANGFQVQVWAVDDGNDVDQAHLRAQELAADPHLLAVVGHLAPETSTIAAQTYLEAGLLQISPVPLQGKVPSAGAGLALSLGAPFPEMADSAAAEVSGVLRCSGGSWPLVGLPDASADAESVVSGCGLLDLTHHLVTAPTRPQKVVLPLGYCPAALVSVLPDVSFYTVTGGTSPTAADLVAAAADLALAAIAAAAGARVTREGVVKAAQTTAQAAGWQPQEGVYYPPTWRLRLHPCPPVEERQ